MVRTVAAGCLTRYHHRLMLVVTLGLGSQYALRGVDGKAGVPTDFLSRLNHVLAHPSHSHCKLAPILSHVDISVLASGSGCGMAQVPPAANNRLLASSPWSASGAVSFA